MSAPVLALSAGERQALLAQLDRQTLRLPRAAGWNGSGCHLWEGPANGDGYGEVQVGARRWLVHRLAWTVYRGPIPANRLVHHACGITLCCNVKHLELLSRGAHTRL